MRVAVFSTKGYDREFLDAANEQASHELLYFETRLTSETCSLVQGVDAVCVFVNDSVDKVVLQAMAEAGVKLLVLRSAGFNHVDLKAASDLKITVVRVPAYSPHAVAEHTLALILALNRHIHRAYNRVRERNFALDGLLGFDVFGKTVGVVGTGKIGTVFSRLMSGFGCELLGYDPRPNDECKALGVQYVQLDELHERSHIISLHCPLTPQTRHLINRESLARMRQGVMLINTSRGAIVDTRAVIVALKSGRIGSLGLDVYEEEADLFFEDLSDEVIQDDVFARLLTFPNVLITGHQGFFTREALRNIAETTLTNVTAFAEGRKDYHEVTLNMAKVG
ncbi:2-hydroxyacid dehydrogenase [Desulfonatronum sp. SC1]|uniref:2-hydroxyacid dehydrogenase n=1 Tax=Desulfonatronum sp. SC1 TaxID=2109626 RepID=UPI000D3255FD|nr:2-hydroxyacid dehydrogenase [Desulfonatronum sp. SC1]PTN39063.1 hydroxyacid dehydrogenase [Desulfonatronum sp. SC1]